jgi:thiamine-phosphate pyrophosphorylase
MDVERMSAQREPDGGLERSAARLGRQARRGKAGRTGVARLPHLWLLTDPARTPDPVAAAAALPRGSVVVYRSFGAHDRLDIARRLRRVTHERGLRLLIGLDWRLARRVGADGVHLPQRAMAMAPVLRRRGPDWLISAAAHDLAAIAAAARWRPDALLVSPVFPSRSPSAGRPLGVVRFAAMTRRASTPVIALGGVNGRTAKRLLATGAAGVAAIDALVAL